MWQSSPAGPATRRITEGGVVVSLKRYSFHFALGAVAFGFPLAAFAQDSAAGSADHVEALRACQGVADPAQRLACYDGSVAAMIAAAEAGELRVVNREAVEQTRRRLFGFSLPDLGIFGGSDDGGDEEEELDELETTITAVRALRGDAWLFQTAEGATWRINDAPQRLRAPKAGQPVEFKKASMGSYFIRINGQIGVKGRRVE